MTAYYDNKPTKLEAVGNGSYLYRMNIEEVFVETDDNNNTKQQWKCDEYTIWSPITPNKITETVITEKWKNNYEQKLINEYNSAMMEIITENANDKIQNYKNYLTERKKIKEQIDKDCQELNIIENN